ncbi:hypothetical protein M7I_0213 [Glarea lozoyensis 74030]|uniref:Uncharacterized protein n=1 Tax=Glarea lozoyensis (strain ATCC 74030 / MF5533) TaxID=1104152 RepID=H0ECR8_GLAL7|nr:hypothetical protein M7I_0213 [Glarea lozoyensis 74030]
MSAVDYFLACPPIARTIAAVAAVSVVAGNVLPLDGRWAFGVV